MPHYISHMALSGRTGADLIACLFQQSKNQPETNNAEQVRLDKLLIINHLCIIYRKPIGEAITLAPYKTELTVWLKKITLI